MGKLCKTKRYKVVVSADTAALLDRTLYVYRAAIAYYLRVFRERQDTLGAGNWLRRAEILTHRTARNPHPAYDFDLRFPLLPSGLRRSAVAEAYGLAGAWHSNYREWQSRKKKHEERNERRVANGKSPLVFTERPPVYPDETRSWPVYYGTEFRVLNERHLLVKVFTGTGYAYRKVALMQPWKVPGGYEPGSPALVRKCPGWELHVPMFLTEKVGLKKAETLVRDPAHRICAVDLGLENHAAVTIQDAEGRVLATLFISGAKDNHLRKRRLEQIVRLQKATGVIPESESFAVDLWRKIRHLGDDAVHQVSRRIVDFAQKHGAKVIVFEHLGGFRPEKGTKSRKLNQKLSYWLRGRIFRYTQYKALHEGIVTVRVNPRDTSRRCPYCGFLAVERYTPGRANGAKLARCLNCGTHDVNADWLATLNIGRKFRGRYSRPA